MKPIFIPLMGVGLALTLMSADAQTAHPRIIAGFDHIALKQVRKVLVVFCKENGCSANTQTGNLIVDNSRPVSIGGGCYINGINYDYCVQTWGNEDRAFMNPARMQQLKAMLEAKGAKVTLMDCHFEWGHSATGHYVCADGKPLPSQ